MFISSAILDLSHSVSAGFLGRPEAHSLTKPSLWQKPTLGASDLKISIVPGPDLASVLCSLQKSARDTQEVYLLASGLRREPISLSSSWGASPWVWRCLSEGQWSGLQDSEGSPFIGWRSRYKVDD